MVVFAPIHAGFCRPNVGAIPPMAELQVCEKIGPSCHMLEEATSLALARQD
jgi:hypothetical protein